MVKKNRLWRAEARLRQKKREIFGQIDYLKKIHGKIQTKIKKLERRRVSLEAEEKKAEQKSAKKKKEVNSKTKELLDEFKQAEKRGVD